MACLPQADRWDVSLICLALCACGADWSGLHFTVGAFLACAVIEAQWFDQRQTALLLMAVANTMLTTPVVAPMLMRLQGLLQRAH